MSLIMIRNFLQEIEYYQSNHYGLYDKGRLVIAYKNLPDEIKKYISPLEKIKKSLWRGCDGLSEVSAVSFTTNKSFAKIFGMYVIPFKELSSFSGLIDSEKCRKLNTKLKFNFEIGDDEGEVIVITPVWNSSINIKKYIVY